MPGYDPTQPEAEDDLDKILKAVNNRVAAPLQTKSAKSKKKILSRVGAHAAKAKNLTKSSKPVAAMGVVIIVALMLCVVAVMAYRQGGQSAAAAHQPGKVGTSYTAAAAIQSAGGTLVRPNDLDDYSQTLEAKLNGLNDTQDFDAASLSDSVLGL
jgi:flagellar biosynthesis/type III secretory pathway M-ring protein FliF/YscJ